VVDGGRDRRERVETVAGADAVQRFDGLRFVGDGMEVLREHDVFEGSEIRHQMKLLEDKTDFFGAVADEFGLVKARDFLTADEDAAGSGGVEAAKNIDECSFAGTGWAHEGDPFAGLNVEADAS